MEFLVLADIHHCWTHLDKMLNIASECDGVIFLGDLMQYGKISSKSFENFLRIHDVAEWMVAVPGNGAMPQVVDFLCDIGVNIHGTSKQLAHIGFFGVGGVPNAIEAVNSLRQNFKENRFSAIDLDAKSVETLGIFGVFIRDGVFEVDEWSPEKLREMEIYQSPFDHTENEIFSILLRAYTDIRDLPFQVLISHIPPFEEGLNPVLPEGVSTGSKAITRFIHEFHPSLVLSGHYHRYHEFAIGSVPCAILPAVKDGYYSLLYFEPNCQQFRIEVNMF